MLIMVLTDYYKLKGRCLIGKWISNLQVVPEKKVCAMRLFW